MQGVKRIPEGTIYGEVPLEAVKFFDANLFLGTGVTPRILYADANTKHEFNKLTVKFLPSGAKTAPHPQIVCFFQGQRHYEAISNNPNYRHSNPFQWGTYAEFHLDARELCKLIDAVIKAELAWEGMRS